MATLNLVITDAGRQAIVDASNTGTLPVTISQVALGTGRWAPTAAAAALQAEIKRIDSVGGQAVADDTIHITITDDSADSYSLGEFGLYTDTGVLFAIYSDDVDGITDKASDALLLLAADVVLTSVPPGAVTINGPGFVNPQATETLAGVAEVATQAETDTGLDDARMVTPKKLMGSAASAATANYLMRRDPAGRAKVAVPSAADDIARKDTVDAVQQNLTDHADSTVAHGATIEPDPYRIMRRDWSGRCKVGAPSEADDVARKQEVDHAAPPGMVAHFARSTPPTGWLKANGTAVSRTAYADLFAAIGTRFGSGDGSTTFNLPDLRGEFIRGWDDGRSVDSGRAFGTVQTDEIKSHNHYLMNIAWSDTTPDTGVAIGPKGADGPLSAAAISSTGGSETRPRNIAMLACIKY